MDETADHDKILTAEGEIKRIWDRFGHEQRALELAAGQWPTREEMAKMIQDLRGDLSRSVMPRIEYEAAHRELENKVTFLQAAYDASEAVARARTRTVNWVIAAAGTFVVVVGYFVSR